MKSYKNKKFYNFKSNSQKKEESWKFSNMVGSSEYLKLKRQDYRTRGKVVLQKEIDNKDINFPLYKRTLWWDS